jgi:GTP-sensing pleiotropic transcriptional regulator CodY
MHLRGRTIRFDQEVDTYVESQVKLEELAKAVPFNIMMEYYNKEDIADYLNIATIMLPKTLSEEMKLGEIFNNWDKFNEQEFLEWVKNK